ncbi:MAG: hypothetical protein ICV53_05240 [Flavisolibacter sp.]|nr:hypothetical protein [Flavisolibacter sp.]
MRTIQVKATVAFWIGLLLSLPTFYFILISVLKYVFNVPLLFDAIEPSMERWGAKEPPGFNINALILFGPLLAFLLNVTAVLRFQIHNSAHNWRMEWFVEKRWGNWLIIILSSLLLLTLFVYALGENCNCSSYHFKTIKHENNLVQTLWPYLFTHTYHGSADHSAGYYFSDTYLYGHCA